MRIEFDFAQCNEGIIKCIINDTYIGIAKCHKDDMDMYSEKTGQTIAQYKALIKYRKAKLNELKKEYYAIKKFADYLKFKTHPKWIEKYMDEFKNRMAKAEVDYEIEKEALKSFIDGKDKFYNSVRKMRTQRDNRNN